MARLGFLTIWLPSVYCCRKAYLYHLWTPQDPKKLNWIFIDMSPTQQERVRAIWPAPHMATDLAPHPSLQPNGLHFPCQQAESLTQASHISWELLPEPGISHPLAVPRSIALLTLQSPSPSSCSVLFPGAVSGWSARQPLVSGVMFQCLATSTVRGLGLSLTWRVNGVNWNTHRLQSLNCA